MKNSVINKFDGVLDSNHAEGAEIVNKAVKRNSSNSIKSSQMINDKKYRLIAYYVLPDGIIDKSYSYVSAFNDVLPTALRIMFEGMRQSDKASRIMGVMLEVYRHKCGKWVTIDEALFP